MLLSRDLGKISQEEFARIGAECDSTGRLINALGRSLWGKLRVRDQSPVTSHQALPE